MSGTRQAPPEFHDRTLTGVAVLDAWLANDPRRLRAVIDTAAEEEVIGGLVNVCRYLLGVVEAQSGASNEAILRTIRTHSVSEIATPSPSP